MIFFAVIGFLIVLYLKIGLIAVIFRYVIPSLVLAVAWVITAPFWVISWVLGFICNFFDNL